MHILSLVSDNNPSLISRREEKDPRNYIMTNLHESTGQGLGLNLRPMDLQSDMYLQPNMLPTALRGLVILYSGLFGDYFVQNN